MEGYDSPVGGSASLVYLCTFWRGPIEGGLIGGRLIGRGLIREGYWRGAN